ncbi:hypothetical protein GIB67_023206 [Kingdonia uniflora]|uniref:2-carboxy-D-arabinitol-1-phosphatase n=1 Tax=Kingdonia uniflora TaxID=39325 RepID=A0A7J7MCF1_9MAGN|nr:hypothetical protein GIB67_023206 [Kingdonia uniflora]
MLALASTLINQNQFLLHKNPNLNLFTKRNPKSLSIRLSSRLKEPERSPNSEEREEELLRSSISFPVIKARKRVVLVRHGQSTWNEEGRIQGSSNFSVLTKKGEAQAKTSREMLANDAFNVCFASPLNRSKRTAEIIWGTRDDEMIFESGLREIDLYSFQGLLKNEGEKKFGAAFQQWKYDASNFNIDGHYPVKELWSRARNCWTKILAHEGKSILVVAHNAVNQSLVASAMGLGPEYFRLLLQSNCGVSVLDFIPRVEEGTPHICLNRLNQTPSSPIAALNSESRKSYKRIILVCDVSTENNIKVQEAGDCLGAESAPQNVEMKQMPNLQVEYMLSQLNKARNYNLVSINFFYQTKGATDYSQLQPGWLNGVDDEITTQLWTQSEKAWNSILDDLSDEPTSEKNVVVVGHPALHIALLVHCLNLKKELLGSFHLDGGSVSVIDFPNGPAGRGVIRCVNYTAHLGRWAIPVTIN